MQLMTAHNIVHVKVQSRFLSHQSAISVLLQNEASENSHSPSRGIHHSVLTPPRNVVSSYVTLLNASQVLLITRTDTI